MPANTLPVWGTNAMPRSTRACGGSAVMSSPSSATAPELSRIMPKIAFIAVDLPAPLGPTMTATSPRPTAIVHSLMMSGPP